jgi:hypothetical protein
MPIDRGGGMSPQSFQRAIGPPPRCHVDHVRTCVTWLITERGRPDPFSSIHGFDMIVSAVSLAVGKVERPCFPVVALIFWALALYSRRAVISVECDAVYHFRALRRC